MKLSINDMLHNLPLRNAYLIVKLCVTIMTAVMLSVFVMSIIMLGVIMLSVIMLSVPIVNNVSVFLLYVILQNVVETFLFVFA